MKQYRKASHCVYDLKYHIVWITKYRKPVLSAYPKTARSVMSAQARCNIAR